MPSILVSVFALQLAIHLINTVSAGTINALLWNVYNSLPTPTAKAAAEQRQMQKEYLKLRRELNATSSQDEFAKAARLRRQHDKVLKQLETIKLSLDASKVKFDSSVSTLRWLGTNGLRFALQWWYTKEPMFWLPQGWVPYYAEWLLSFPRAPLGSVSIQAWVLACGAFILLVSDAITALVGLMMEMKSSLEQKQKTKAEPMKFFGEKKAAERPPGGIDTSKKEL